jgi:hypothetical protein
VSAVAGLFDRLEAALTAAVAAGEVGVARSLRLHVGGVAAGLPTPDRLLALGDRLFACPRQREMRAGDAVLCVWAEGQVATLSVAPAPRPVVVLTLLGSAGALHLREPGP